MTISTIFKTGAVLAVTLAAAPAKAQTGCTNEVLSGNYGLRISGSLAAPLPGGVAGVKTPDSAVSAAKDSAVAGYARLAMDANGTVLGSAAASIGGAWSEGPVTGEYTVNDDCTFAMTLKGAEGEPQHFEGVLARTGDGAWLFQSDAGTGLSGELSRAPWLCDPTAVGGAMKLQISGAAFSSIAKLDVNEGVVTACESRFSEGKLSRVSSTGSITIGADCTVTMSLSAAADGALATYRGIVLNGHKSMLLVRSDPGISASGEASAQ